MSSVESTAISVRPWSSADHGEASAIYASIFPSYVGNDSTWRLAAQFDTREDQPHRMVATSVTGQVIGYSAIRYIRSANARIDLMVHPDWQRQGIGSQLLTQILGQASSRGVHTAHVRVRWDAPESLSFVKRRGFAETHKMHGLRIDLTSLDEDLCTQLQSRLATQGVSVFQFSRDGSPSTIDQLLELYNSVKDGWPSPEAIPSEPTTRAQFMDLVYERLDSFPDVPLFIATNGKRFIGFCGIRALGTAVHPEYRGRGIATGLKALVLLEAKERGETTAFTCTANPSMMSINERLGYTCESVEVRLWKATGSTG